ncbi:unannotated protein [freshwater metagenome]|uniref:Unannotated protein n=1 Tax=freshwater metagenome TaxID=449393 RepID=A0A6J6QZA1_9ZZZZ
MEQHPVAGARLVTVAHGTRTAAGNDVARELTGAAASRLRIAGVTSYVELSEPLLTDVLASSPTPTVVLPLLLSTGFHLRQDLPAAVAGAGGPVVLGRSLGPHRLVAAAQVARLAEAGVEPGSARLVLVAAGSSDPVATRDLARAADLLGRAWGSPVEVATLTALGRRPAEVVRPGDVVSPYLLAPGHFAERSRRESLAAGAAVVADVLGPHPLLVDLICRRARALMSGARLAAATRAIA